MNRPDFFEPEPRTVTMAIARSYVTFPKANGNGQDVFDLLATKNDWWVMMSNGRITQSKWRMLSRLLDAFLYDVAINYEVLMPDPFQARYLSPIFWFRNFGVRFDVEAFVMAIPIEDLEWNEDEDMEVLSDLDNTGVN
jgi:hypothetical protein